MAPFNPSDKRPLVSIITVVYNGEKHLENTINSIINQSYKNIEYIIIDGASKDRTIEIIKRYESKISKWISEPDKGIYDAMNKGLQIAKGDYVWFINAGDEIYSSDTLKNIFDKSTTFADIYYGETEEMEESGERIGMRRLKTPEQLTWKNLSMGMVVCHQSIIVKKEIIENYNINYKYSADIDWMINVLKKSEGIINTKLILSKFKTGGISRNNIIKSLKERFKIMAKHYGFFTTLFNHFIIGTKFIFFVLRNRRY